MKAITEVLLFGSLRKERGEYGLSPAHCELESPTPLLEILKSLQIQPKRVQLVMVNHRAVPSDHVIQPGDRVALFPREYAIFADWKDMRF